MKHGPAIFLASAILALTLVAAVAVASPGPDGSARGCRVAADRAAAPPCGAPVPTIGLNGSARAAGNSIDIPYRGFYWNPGGGQISLGFSGESAGKVSAAESFSGTLKIDHWPKRTDVDGAVREGSTGYCWGTLTARQGSTTATTGKISGVWKGWILWSADPTIKAKEAWCEGEDRTYLSRSPEPIVAFGLFATQGSPGQFGLKVFNLDTAAQNSPVYLLKPGSSINVNVSRRQVCVRVAVNQQGKLSTAVAKGSCQGGR